MRWGTAWLLALAWAGTGLAGDASRGVPIARDGQPDARIVLPDAASPTLTAAAQELVAYVEKMSGAKLVVGPAAPGQSRIVLEVDAKSLAEEDAFRIVTRPGEIRLSGGGPLGAMYAAYALLEDLGVRWLYPGDDGELVPRRPTLDYPATDRTERPSFHCRFFYVRSPEAMRWAVRNRLNGFFDQEFAAAHGNGFYLPPMVGSIHSFVHILPPEKYFDSHPEYYALIRGQRVRPSITSNQLCTSNPAVIEILARAIRAYFQATPDARCFSIAPNDGYGWCECENCKALDERLAGSRKWYHRESEPVVSDRLCVFANEVAKRSVADMPGKELYMFAYVSYCEPPRTARPDPHVTHVVCHYIPACYAHPIATPGCPDNELYDGYLKQWAKISPQAMVYCYTDKSQWLGLPRPVVRPMAADIRHYRELGMRKYLAQSGAVAWPTAGPLYYVTAKLLWNADQDVEQLIRQWNQGMYGAAADEMTAWYDAMEKVVARSHGHYGGDPMREVTNVYAAGCFAEAAKHIERALSLADSPAAKSRIERVKTQFDYGVEGVDAICGNAKWEESGDLAVLSQAQQAAKRLLARKGIWNGISMKHFRDFLEGLGSVSPQGVRWQGFGKPEEKGGRTCRNSDETGPGDNAAGWASFTVLIDDFKKSYRVSMDVWGESDFSSLTICTQGRGQGSAQGGVWKPLPRDGKLSGKPEWCTITFTVPPAMLDKATRRQIFGFGGRDSQVWVADIRFAPAP